MFPSGGEQLQPRVQGVSVRILETPLPAALASRAMALVYPVLHEEFLEDLLLGRFGPGAQFLSALAFDGDRLAGHAWAGWGVEAAPIGVMAGVVTDERYRRRGIASGLVAELCKRFDSAGGALFFLGTTNPEARRLYERFGFRSFTGNVYCRGEHALMRDLAPGLPVSAHRAGWADIGRILPLYLLPHPCIVIDAGVELLSTRLAPPWRCFRIFWDTWRSIESGGDWELLINSAGWAVASAVARPNARPGGGFHLDFVWHSDYPDAGCSFVGDFVERMEARYQGAARLLLCDGDEWKRRAAEALGFTRARRAAGHILHQGRRLALDEYRRD